MDCVSTDVAIIGAGPAGMALACELIRYGLSVRIVDKSAGPKHYSRAPILWPRAQECLDLMGIHHLWNGHTAPWRYAHLNVYGQPAGTLTLDTGDSAYATPLLVGQDVTEQIFDAYLRHVGIPVERSVEATKIEIHDGGAQIALNKADGSEETLDARWVIGCEGTKSIVRDAAGIGWEGHELVGLMILIADATAIWPLPRTQGHAFAGLTDEGYVALIPLPDAQRIVIAVPDTTPPDEEPAATLDDVAAAVEQALGAPVSLTDSPWATVIRYGNHIAPVYRKGRAILAGDAAHGIAPLSGQGMNTGIQDAFDLGWKLAYVHKGWAPESLLDTYTADRRPVAKWLESSTDRMFSLVCDPAKLKKRLFRVAAPVALSFSRVRETAAEFFTEVGIHYPDSPLNDAHHHRAPRPGDHARDGAMVRWPDLESIRLYDDLLGTHWSVLAFTGGERSAEAIAHLHARLVRLVKAFGVDRLHALLIVGYSAPPADLRQMGTVDIALDSWRLMHEKYDADDGGLVLVRPDGYVTLNRAPDDHDFDAAERLLDRTLVRAENSSVRVTGAGG
jgi:3-(3-hydroxy-phenyl)propionate hydroxylase